MPATPTSRCYSPSKRTTPRRRRATKAAIFRADAGALPPRGPCRDAAEALAVSLNETGRVDWPRMEELTDKSQGEALEELGTLVYRNPEGGDWETADGYLSGNVRAKLAAAEAATGIDASLRAQHRSAQSRAARGPGAGRHRGATRLVLDSGERHPDFVAELLDTTRDSVNVHYAAAIATWTVELDYRAKYQVSNTTTHGTARFRASDLIEQALERRAPRPPTTSTRTAPAPSTSRRPSPRARRQQQLKNASGSGSGRTPAARAPPCPRLQRPLQQSAPARISTART